jgi:hypothetical protein
MPRWPMNGSTHVRRGSGDHTTQKGKRSALGSIAAAREPPRLEGLLAIVEGDANRVREDYARGPRPRVVEKVAT